MLYGWSQKKISQVSLAEIGLILQQLNAIINTQRNVNSRHHTNSQIISAKHFSSVVLIVQRKDYIVIHIFVFVVGRICISIRRDN